ncbi:alcohol dehydrogenase [Cryptotrichosporon argae]
MTVEINRQAIVETVGDVYKVVDGAVPEIAADEALVRLTHSGVCYTGGHIRLPGVERLVGGHEGIGTVLKTGADVDASTLAVGQRVGMGFLSSTCKECEMCASDDEAYCPKQIPTGFKCDGTFQEYAAFKAEYLIPIPEQLDSASSAPLLCAGATVYSGLKASGLKHGQWVVIPGAGGGLGHIAVQYAKAMGGRVIGIDAGDKEELVLSCGAEYCIDFKTEEDVAGRINKLTGGGAHVIVVTSVPAYSLAWQYVRLRGTVVCLGMGPTDFDASLAVVKGIKVLGSSTSTRQELKEALDLAVTGNVRAIHEIRTLDDVERTMWELKQGQIKGRVVIDLTAA